MTKNKWLTSLAILSQADAYFGQMISSRSFFEYSVASTSKNVDGDVVAPAVVVREIPARLGGFAVVTRA